MGGAGLVINILVVKVIYLQKLVVFFGIAL